MLYVIVSDIFAACLIDCSKDYAVVFYGPLPLNQSQSRPRRERVQISSLSTRIGERVLLRARVHTSRGQAKMVFFILRQRSDSVQALLSLTPEKVSKQMVKWAGSIPIESIVLVEGQVTKAPEPIKSASVDDVEVHISQVTTQCSIIFKPFSSNSSLRSI